MTELLRTLSDRLGPAHTALIVVDMQNDFCAPGGYVANLGRDVSACGAIVPAAVSYTHLTLPTIYSV